ncbi:TPA: hypothetical protein DIV55_02745 [Patescibacteria group bacterium]|uniref:26 kDa periplasmic immunogenic protein n=1 Tax=Candidatus Gottesmanbacteria bacterium GW2011_GWA1_43_11 TaxID=1618436 RepID=A0A0G1F9I8_9BACT|nr:MAG: hypothetical protein UV59_C0037G0022 [Candidatus Gottesmanbacteria bacterium GW2011_GWA1_43_11]HCS78638.1 hypothetical protein [Patescibacteria group bacterium]
MLGNEPAAAPNGKRSIYFFIENRPFLVFAIIAVIFLGIFAYFQLYPRPTRVVTTIGVGSKQVAAQKALVIFAVTASAADRNSAATQGEAKFVDVMNMVNSYQPSSANKTAYRVAPQVVNQLTGETNGFQYVSGAQITLEGVANVTNLVRQLNEKDATVAQVRFLPQDEKAIDKEVRELAIADAKVKAEQMAAASGARLGKVLNVTEQASTGTTGTSVTKEQQASVAGSFSDIEIQSVVQVTFELK